MRESGESHGFSPNFLETVKVRTASKARTPAVVQTTAAGGNAAKLPTGKIKRTAAAPNTPTRWKREEEASSSRVVLGSSTAPEDMLSPLSADHDILQRNPSPSPCTHNHQWTKPGYHLRSIFWSKPDGPSNRYRYRCRNCTDAQPTNKMRTRDELVRGPSCHKGYRCNCY